MKLATYNINSVRLRIDRVLNLLREEKLDILCLQETKAEDEKFPAEPLKKLGYEYLYFSGEKSYNGVAIISRLPLKNVHTLDLVNGHKRHIAATLPDGTELHNFYIPAGGDIPDRKLNDKFAHKLDYCDAITEWFGKNRKPKQNIIAVGDFNIAPFEHDVWSHKQLLGVVSHTPIEVEKLTRMRDSFGWVDTAREFVPHDQKLYSWWSYRNQDWRKSDRGRRLDHIWVTEPMKKRLKETHILKDRRDGEKPSDHVPVVLELHDA